MPERNPNSRNPTVRSPLDGGFRIWEGVVEDINDPESAGRVRVRVFGLHTENLDEIPVESLPWAMTLQPTNSPSAGGIGSSGTGLLCGATVSLYFRDAPENQHPVVIGSFLGVPVEKRPPDVGFQDPTGFLPREDRLGEPDTNRLARGIIDDTSVEDQNNSRSMGVTYPVASSEQKRQEALAEKNTEAGESGAEQPQTPPSDAEKRDAVLDKLLGLAGLSTDDLEQLGLDADTLKAFGLTDDEIKILFLGEETETVTENPEDPENPIVEKKKATLEYSSPDKNLQTWDEPESPYNAKYTYNKVYESQSGHVVEMDDTPNAERIRLYHRSGTMVEVHPDGTKVQRSKGSDYVIVENDQKINVKGDYQISVSGNSNVLITGKATTLISGSNEIAILGATKANFFGKTTAYFGSDLIAEVIGNMNATVNQNLTANVVGNTDLKTQKLSISAMESVAIKTSDFTIDADTMTISSGTLDIDAFTTLYGDFTGTILASGTLDGLATTAGYAPILESAPSPIIPSFSSDDPDVPTAAQIQPSAAEMYREDDYPEQVQLGASDTTYRQPSSDPKAQQALGLPDDNAPLPKTNPTEKNMEESPAVAPAPTAPEGTPPAPDGTPPIGCTVFENPLNPSNRLSKHITLGNLQIKGDVVKPQNGLSAEKIVCNLQKLSQQILDKVIDQWGRPYITDGFRSVNVAKRIGSKPSSMHCYGTACDLQWSGKDEKYHYDVAVWIKENCPFAELILEYGGRSGPWIHVAYNDDPSNNAKKTNNTKSVMTRVNAPSDYQPGLKLLKNVPGVGGR